MNEKILSNSNIDLTCEEVGNFLASAGVERREALHMKLTFEEVLLEYQEKFGEQALFKVRCIKRFPSIRVEIVVPGDAYDPLNKEGEDDAVIQSLLAKIGLAPTWSYKNNKNYIVFIPNKKSLSGTVKMAGAIGLAIFCGISLNTMPEGFRMAVNSYFLTPLTDVFMGLISAVAGPLIFLSVLGSICSMGNLETLGKIGSKTITVLLTGMAMSSIFMTVFASLFYRVELGSGGVSGFSQVLDLIYDVIPSNLFEPFVTGNALQMIFVAIMIGLAMLVLSSRVNGVFGLIEQFTAIVQTLMSGLSYMLPVLIFLLFTGIISNGNFGVILNSWKMVAVIVSLLAVFYVVNILRIAVLKKVSPVLLFKKALPTFAIAFTTASPDAAFAKNISDARKKLGIDKKLVKFGTSLGQVLFGPADVAILICMELTFAEMYGIPITPAFLCVAMITNLLVSFSIPPVPGGAIMGYTIALTQLGIPMEAMGIVLAVDAIMDFPANACNVSSWQLILIDIADSLGMLNKEILHQGVKKSK